MSERICIPPRRFHADSERGGSDPAGTLPSDLSRMLGQVLNNPQAMSLIRSLRQNTEGGGSDAAPGKSGTGGSGTAGTGGKASPGSNGIGSGTAGGVLSAEGDAQKNNGDPAASRPAAHSHEERVKLLNALRPYLGAERRQKIDRIIQLMELLRAAQTAGIGGLLGMGADHDGK